MFTGIIQGIGEIISIDKSGDWIIMVSASMPLDDVAIGASIACSGVCLTVIGKNAASMSGGSPPPLGGGLGGGWSNQSRTCQDNKESFSTTDVVSCGATPHPTLPPRGEGFHRAGGQFIAQISAETIDKTTAKNWNVGTRLNLERALRLGDELGGHIVSGHVDGVARVVDRRDDGDSARFTLDAPLDLACFVAPKGSVVLDGVSLTVNEAGGATFGVNIIPHTQRVTTLGERQIGDELNFEVDLIARYVGRMLERRL